MKNFRNYHEADVYLDKGINIIYGNNAQGKTNLAEAVYYLCVGKSPRTPREKELIKWDEQKAYVRIDAVKNKGRIKIEAYLTRTENRRISINGMPIKRIGELMGAVNAVFFSPDEIKIIKEAPADRRRFIDIDLSQLSKTYFYNLNRYNKILAQRNKLLKSQKNLNETLSIWDEQLTETGSKVAYSRKEFVNMLAKFAVQAHSFLTDGSENLKIIYEGIEGESQKDIRENFTAGLKKEKAHDIEYGYTHTGIHKDDIAILIDDVDVRAFGSQGQQRTAALAMKLAELEIFASLVGEPPVLILDDVFSELDIFRQNRLLEKIKNIQTIITCTDTNAKIQGNMFCVNNGKISLKQNK